MEEWNIIKAYDYCYNVTDGTHDSPKQTEFGKYLITSKHIKDNRIDFESAYKISEDDYNKIITRSKVDQWDIIISMIGAYCGFCCIESSKQTDYAIKNVGLLKVGNELKCKWLYYYLTSPHGKQQLSKLRSGSSQPYISLGALRNLDIPVPNENTMSDIVSVLSSLDSKIELNRRINDNLEQQAQALFKSWFVDFEPFKDGKFVDSELGMIPEGWEIEPLVNFCSEITRGNIPSYVEKSKFPILNQKVNKGFYLDKQYYKFNADTARPQESKLAHKWDILLNSLGQGTLGRVHFYKDEISNIIVDQFITILRSDIFVKSAYLAFTLNRPEYQSIIESNITGSTGMWVLTINNIRKIKIISPPITELKKISDLIENIYLKLNNNTKEQEKLVTLRESLLPKLMSGELKINDLHN